jgi:hypothetical protein
MAQETIQLTEQQKQRLEQLSQKYMGEYLKFEDGMEMVLSFNVDEISEEKSQKFGNDQVVFTVTNPNQPFVEHKWTVSSKRLLQQIFTHLKAGRTLLRIKREGEGQTTRYFVDALD